MHKRHDAVHASAHVVCSEAADEDVEFFGGGADAEEEGDFDEYEDEAGDAVGMFVLVLLGGGGGGGRGDEQAEDTEEDEDGWVEDVGDAEGDA